MSADKLLDRMPRARKGLRPGEFWSGCPAHGSRRGRPVHIAVHDDGRILLHPFCGCAVEDVLAAVGLSFSDLYPERLTSSGENRSFAPARTGIPARDLLALVDHEVLVAVLIVDDILATNLVTEEQRARLTQAAARIGKARSHG